MPQDNPTTTKTLDPNPNPNPQTDVSSDNTDNNPAPKTKKTNTDQVVTTPSMPVVATDNQNTSQKTPNPNPPQNPESVITSSHVPQKYGGKKIIAAILGILLLIGGVGTGVYLIGQQQEIRIGAWYCDKYVFEISREGTVKTINGSRRNEPGQKARVYINDTLVATLDVPALKSGEAATIGSVPTPGNQGFTWKVVGTIDCDDSGSYDPAISPTPPEETPAASPTEPPQATPTKVPCRPKATCTQVKAYDNQWSLVTDLTTLKANDIVRFSVSGTTNTGSIQKARFSVNGSGIGETTNKKPGTDEFYIEYTIPEGTTSFSVKAELYHSEFGWF